MSTHVSSPAVMVPRPRLQDEQQELDRLTGAIIGSAIDVHRALGPGLLESAYQACMAQAMARRGLTFQRQKPLPISFQGVTVATAYRLDFVVGGAVIVELKAQDRVLPVHRAQLLSYLKASGCKVGLLINFHVCQLKDGLQRVVHHYPERQAPAPLRSLLAGRPPSLRSRVSS